MNKYFQLIIMTCIIIASQMDIYPQIKIMPVGETTAWGGSSLDWSGYRRPLHILLTGHGYNVNFVGSQQFGIPDDFDRDNECHLTLFADHDPDTTKNRNLVKWIYQYLVDHPAKIVLLYIGTTDLCYYSSAETVVSEVENVLNEINRYENDYKRDVTVLLSTLIKCSDNPALASINEEISKFNSGLVDMAKARINDPIKPDNIVIVDMEKEADLDYRVDSQPPYSKGDLRDDVFPNDSGFVKMARVWAKALYNVLGAGDPNLLPLDAPVNDTVLTTNSITFKWKNLSPTDNFRLQVANDYYFKNINFDQGNLSKDSLKITGLKSANYFWRIIKNDNNRMLYSSIRQFSIQTSSSDTSALLNLTAEIISSNSVRLSWNDITDNELGFVIERKYGRNNFIVIDTVGANTTSYTDSDTSLHLGPYTYRIKNFNETYISAYSNEVSIQIRTFLNPPANLSAVTLKGNKVLLSWDDESTNEYGFTIERKIGGGNFTILKNIPENTVSYIDSNLTAGINYTYRIYARRNTLRSEYSNEVAIRLIPILSAPTNLTAKVTSFNSVLLKWLSGKDNKNGFIIERKIGGGNFSILDTLSSGTLSYLDSNLKLHIPYSYRIKSFNKDTVSSYSNQVVVNINSVLLTPSNFNAQTVSSNKVLLSWKDGDNNAIGFILEKKNGNGIYNTLDTVKATSYLDSSISAGFAYSYRIKSYNKITTSPYSKEVTILITSIENNTSPKEFKLSQNFPNPFNPVSTINFQIPVTGLVKLIVYDILGNEVKILVNEEKSAGYYSVKLDGSGLSSGVYFYKLAVANAQNNYNEIKKFILLK